MSKWVQSYRCVKCQEHHSEGQPIYRQHILHQSKHGISRQQAGPWVDWQKSDPTAEGAPATPRAPAPQAADPLAPSRSQLFPCGCRLLTATPAPIDVSCPVHRPNAYRALDLSESTPVRDLRATIAALEDQLTLIVRDAENQLGIQVISLHLGRTSEATAMVQAAFRLAASSHLT